MVEENNMFGKSERSLEKAIELSGRPADSFKKVRVSVELTPIEVQALNIIYNAINPEVAPDMKALAKYLLQRGVDSAFSEIRRVLQMRQALDSLPPELRDLLGGFGKGFDKGGPQI